MLTNICQYLHNFFDYKRYIGEIKVVSGEAGLFPSEETNPNEELYPRENIPAKIYCNGKQIKIEEGQHFALFRDRFVLGVYKEGDELPNKTFEGAVWLMDVPEAILEADAWAEEWNLKNGSAEANGPFQSESFCGYSYTKGSSANGGVGSGVFDQAQFKAMLAPYKKIRL